MLNTHVHYPINHHDITVEVVHVPILDVRLMKYREIQ